MTPRDARFLALLLIALACALPSMVRRVTPPEQPSAHRPDPAPIDALLFGQKMDLNRADVAALQLLPGVGPKTAQRIRAGRPYHRVEALRRVKGIGPHRLAALLPLVTVTPAATSRRDLRPARR